MTEIKKALILPKLEYYETHLSLINCILPIKMTPVPIKVLATFMALEGDIEIDRFGSSARYLVRQALNLSSAGLSNHMKYLLINGFIYYTPQGKIKIYPLLLPDPTQQDYRFRLLNNGENDIPTPITLPTSDTDLDWAGDLVTLKAPPSYANNNDVNNIINNNNNSNYEFPKVHQQSPKEGEAEAVY